LNTCCERENGAIREELAELRMRDSLTGLYNRGHFYRFASAAVKKHREDAVQALLYIRPDHFSGIDERIGPLASDALLKSIADLINECAGRNTVVSRFGGNVFTILLVRRSIYEIRQLAEKLVEAIANSAFAAGDQTTQITVSVGMVELTTGIKDTAQAFAMAQKASRNARSKGGNCLHIENSAEEEAASREDDRRWVRKILSALVEDDFQLAFQPIAGLMASRENITDVLVRMLDKEGQEILPGEFMPAADRAGLMPDIDKWVIGQALSLATERQESEQPLILILRISEPSLMDPGFESWLATEFGKYSLEPGTIVFQVTEAIAEQHWQLLQSLSACCQKINCGLAIAHFGMSDNCMQLLEDLKLDYLIFDGSFMEDLNDASRKLRLEQIAAQAKEKEIPTVATRVEDSAALTALCQMGVDYIQGYHLQEPEVEITENVFMAG
jgi:diguanylate cyclase (GGDEF)-like protein